MNKHKFYILPSVKLVLLYVVLFSTTYSLAKSKNEAELTIWGSPGKEIATSKNYEVTLKQGKTQQNLFVYYSFNKNVNKVIDHDGERLYEKHSLFQLRANQYIDPEKNNDTYAHSWGYFDFKGEPVEITVKLHRMPGITFPLKSCAIYPEHLNVKCKILNDSTISFILKQPAKIAVIPNYLQANQQIKDSNKARALEGYRNPLFIFARAPQTNVPDKYKEGTLVVKPGQKYSFNEFKKAKLIYFEAGIHDYSVTENPDNYFVLQKNQQLYLEGGAYLYAQFTSTEKRMLISEMPLIFGRGTISGDKNVWNSIPYIVTVIRTVKLDGIQIADPHNHVSHSSSPFKNIAVVGAWHGNTDGVTIEDGLENDPYEGYNADDCFVMGGDTNLKFRGKARIRNYTIWQMDNAEPFWIADSNFGEVDGVNVLYYGKMNGAASNPGQAINAHLRATYNNNMSNIYVKNIEIKVPFLVRLFLISSAYKGKDVAYKNVVFENIIVNSPFIQFKSPIGNIEKGYSPFGKIVFRNLVINGVKVTNENCRDYFELLEDVTPGNEIVFE